ncbi:RNA methyltransferase, TrmH family, group 3 [Alkalidesulfovibrio alkalitolerans DSM 16529]|uniref:RNA methyltransferase, TrmH family, group 3 n=1 Tax=Alkalidesulfovibrio alkalitolerans DSM 16529 TaxID=1121439 RepID=S7TCW7_9BACT|nr:23S rRNA (guanosine(2251)-2'-O)-methyltransferase RlmB [Alkalidesulfovibrio alkalitolerans]EPR34501.1 RNA methyltransferase, TrmH family, group 3 [Alkalidesulfovibrio alkalitolerans DSM 16529]
MTDTPHFHDEQPTILAGRHPVEEALRDSPGRVLNVLVLRGHKGGPTDRILDACRASGVRFKLAEKAELDRLYKGPHQGVVALLAPMENVTLDDLTTAMEKAPLPLIVALDQVQDPHNVGALARTLLALGGAGLILPKHGAARLGPGALKASAGALSRLPVARVTNLAQALDALAMHGLEIHCASTGPGATSCYEARLDLPAVLVLGNEGQGVRPGVAKRCGSRLTIPMTGGFDSLNVAQAGAILISHFARAALQPRGSGR